MFVLVFGNVDWCVVVCQLQFQGYVGVWQQFWWQWLVYLLVGQYVVEQVVQQCQVVVVVFLVDMVEVGVYVIFVVYLQVMFVLFFDQLLGQFWLGCVGWVVFDIVMWLGLDVVGVDEQWY